MLSPYTNVGWAGGAGNTRTIIINPYKCDRLSLFETCLQLSYNALTIHSAKERTKMTPKTIVVLKGDQTGQELLDEALRVIDPSVIGFPVTLETYDLSLENRRATKNDVVREAATRIKETGLGIKAATITPPEKGDVGSPNAMLRELVDGQVILRTGRRIPSIRPIAAVHAPIAVVRMAVDGEYSE